MVNLFALLFALANELIFSFFVTKKTPARIAVISPLLIGDTLMSVPLIARIRCVYPEAEIVLVVTNPLVSIFQCSPYGVVVHVFSRKRLGSFLSLWRKGPFDIGFALGENRYATLAKAIGCKRVIALANGLPRWRNFFIDQSVWPSLASANVYEWQECLQESKTDVRYNPRDFAFAQHFKRPIDNQNYVLIHIGSSKSEKRGNPEFWRAILNVLPSLSSEIVLAVGPGEEGILNRVDPEHRFSRFIGSDDLTEYWAVVRDAKLLICVDSSAAHLGKLTQTPTICLYGPGGAALTGKTEFFIESDFTEVTYEELPNKQFESVFARDLPKRAKGDVLTREEVIKTILYQATRILER